MIAWDTETCGLDFWHGTKPFLVTMCDENDNQRFWEWTVNPLTRQPDVLPEDVEEIKSLIESDVTVFHSGKFDAHALRTVGIDNFSWDRHDDTLLAAHLLASDQPHNLTNLADVYLGVDIKPLENALEKAVKKARDLVGKQLPDWRIATKTTSDLPSAKDELWRCDYWLPRALMMWWSVSDIPGTSNDLREFDSWWTVLSDYANADTAITIHLWQAMSAELTRLNLWDQYIEARKLPRVFYKMEERGVTCSLSRLRDTRRTFSQESNKERAVCTEIATACGYDLELPKSGMSNSLRWFCWDHSEFTCNKCGRKYKAPYGTRQTKCKKCKLDIDNRIVVSHLGLPVVATTETGAASLDAKTAIPIYLATLDGEQHEFIRALAASRKFDTAITFLKAYDRFVLPYDDVHPDWKVMHPSNNITGTHTLRTSQQSPNGQQICFDAETEVLTDDGWVRADNLTANHNIAQYWKQSGKIDFVHPSDVHSPHFNGHMLHIKTEQQIDMMLTPAHRCLLQDRKTLRKFDKPASEFRGDCLHFQAGEYVGGDVSMPESLVAWLCAVQADGHYQTSRREQSDPGGDYGIKFTFRKQRKIDRMRWLLKSLDAGYTEKVSVSGVGFYVGKHEPITVMARDLMPDKCFGSWLLNLDRATLNLVTAELFNWDGDHTRKSSWSSTQKENSDWVQTLFVLSGSRAMMSSRIPTTESTSLYHTVNITHNRDSSLTSNFTSTQVNWDGPVYCVTVPSSYIVIRRNGKVSITGNSKQEDFTLRTCFGPAPGREWWSMDYQNLELRIPAYKAPEQSWIDLFERPDDPPYFGSNHLLVAHKLHPKLFSECRDDKGNIDGRIFKKRYSSTYYQWLKNGNFAIQYGAQEELADKTYRVPGAFKMLKQAFSGITKLNDRLMAEASVTRSSPYYERYGYIHTALGYPLRVLRSEYGRPQPTLPLSYYVQGTAMECSRRSMWRVQDYLDEVNAVRDNGYYMILLVHDEIVYDFPFAENQGNIDVIKEIKRLMLMVGSEIGVPLGIGVEYHTESWAKGVSVKL